MAFAEPHRKQAALPVSTGHSAPRAAVGRKPLPAGVPKPWAPGAAGSQKWELQRGTEEVNVHLPPNVNVSR